jgi:hypothetical protein
MQLAKLVNLLSTTDRLERANLLVQIRLNHLVFRHTPADAGTIFFQNFLAHLKDAKSPMYSILEPGGEALVLLAMERNGSGKLSSIDLPPLYDPAGSFTGLIRFKEAMDTLSGQQ